MKNQTVGQRIRALRKEKKLTQAQLAKIADVSAPAVTEWEKDSYLPKAVPLKAMANYFGITTDDILYGDMRPAQSQRMGDMVQSQGTPVINENFLTQSPRSHALNALINKLDELEQQHLISEDEVSLLKHTLDVLAKSKSSSTNGRQPQNPIFKDEK